MWCIVLLVSLLSNVSSRIVLNMRLGCLVLWLLFSRKLRLCVVVISFVVIMNIYVRLRLVCRLVMICGSVVGSRIWWNSVSGLSWYIVLSLMSLWLML